MNEARYELDAEAIIFCLFYWCGRPRQFVPSATSTCGRQCSCPSPFLPPVHPKKLLRAPATIRISISAMSKYITIFDKSKATCNWGHGCWDFCADRWHFYFQYWDGRNLIEENRQRSKRIRASWTYCSHDTSCYPALPSNMKMSTNQLQVQWSEIKISFIKANFPLGGAAKACTVL